MEKGEWLWSGEGRVVVEIGDSGGVNLVKGRGFEIGGYIRV